MRKTYLKIIDGKLRLFGEENWKTVILGEWEKKVNYEEIKDLQERYTQAKFK